MINRLAGERCGPSRFRGHQCSGCGAEPIRLNAPEALRESLARHFLEDHLTPEEVGKLAKEAGVKRVVLVHLVPNVPDEAARNLCRRCAEVLSRRCGRRKGLDVVLTRHPNA